MPISVIQFYNSLSKGIFFFPIEVYINETKCWCLLNLGEDFPIFRSFGVPKSEAMKLSGDMAMDSDGNMMMRMSDNMTMDMDSGELHITSSWDDDND